jgi:hypothetical protein
MGGHVSVASKEVIYSKMVQKEVCFVSVADRGLRPKIRLQKAKTPAKWLALSVSGTTLPKKHYTLRLFFCQYKIGKIAGGGRGEIAGESQRLRPWKLKPGHPAIVLLTYNVIRSMVCV